MNDARYFRCASCGGLNRVATEKMSEQPKCGRCKTPIDLYAHPQEVDDEALATLVKTSPVPVLVDFWAPWCGPCKAVAPHLVELAKRNAGKLLIAKVNTDAHQRTASQLGVRAIPTLAVYKGGQVVRQQAGALSGPQLDAFVSPHI